MLLSHKSEDKKNLYEMSIKREEGGMKEATVSMKDEAPLKDKMVAMANMILFLKEANNKLKGMNKGNQGHAAGSE